MKSSQITGSGSSVWVGSQLPKKTAPLKTGVQPWEMLSAADREKFAAVFLREEACDLRSRLLLRKIDPSVVEMLNRIQSGAKNKSLALEVVNELRDYILLKMFWGNWTALAALAKYGMEHAKDGILKGHFPSLSEYLNSAGDEMAVLILQTFVELSGLKIDDLLLPFSEDPPRPPTVDGKEFIRSLRKQIRHQCKRVLHPEFVPRGLPTKRALKEAVSEKWSREPHHFDRELKRVGLAGLPKAKPQNKRKHSRR